MMFQSTHPHGVRHLRTDPSQVAQRVSIHAPTWGATLRTDPSQVAQRVSIHAPTWGATAEESRKRAEKEFQSTHPHGVRPVGSVVVDA